MWYKIHPPCASWTKLPFQDENKRLCSELSPIDEASDSDIVQQIHSAVEESINAAIPRVKQHLETSLQSAIQKSIPTALVGLRDEVSKAKMNELEQVHGNSELKMWCENYNERDNLRIFVREELSGKR